MNPFDPPAVAIREAVARALAEDLNPLGDLTSALLPRDVETTATFGARAAGRLAGTACATEAFRQVDATVEVTWLADDGAVLEPGQILGEVRGLLSSVLIAERTALNFLGHLSGIASYVEQFVAAAARGGSAQVWDTRKTTPGLRALEKAAVRAGGGRNHRGNLSEWVMFKDNHLTGTTIADAVAAAHAAWPGRTVHVECDRYDQVLEALEAGADALLLDNMTPDEIRKCVAAAEGHRALLEVSGGITLDTIESYAGTGAHMISSGALTNSAPVLDIGLDMPSA